MSSISAKADSFLESVIRTMTRVNAVKWGPERAVNFAQGFPDFEPSPEIVQAAQQAIAAGGAYHQYPMTWGAPELRQAIAERKAAEWGVEIDPETQVTVSCGATEAMIATMLGLVDPGQEVIVFEPFYENYGPDCILSEARVHYVTLRPPDWSFDPGELRAAFGPQTRAIIVNTPHNPTGKVYIRDELAQIAALCQEFDVIAITDEIYEHLVYSGEHVSIATLPGMADRTVTISGASKTYSVTGWRVGWAVAAPALSDGIRKVHDFLTVGAAHPFQIAVASALRFPPSFHDAVLEEYRQRRDLMLGGLRQIGFAPLPPQGAYYTMAGIEGLTELDDTAFAKLLVDRAAVATVPASSFYSPAKAHLGRGQLRFSFPKRLETIERGLIELQAALEPAT